METGKMQAVRVSEFGGVEVLQYEEIVRPTPEPGQLLVRVKAAGVGPWDAWIRSGKSALPQPLPLTPGSDIAGVVEAVGGGVDQFALGSAVYGVTNSRFTGGYAEYALADSTMMAARPESLSFVEAASVPVVAVMAWQMVFEHGNVDATKRVLIHGGAGNVGAYAVQLAKQAGAQVIATGRTSRIEAIRALKADEVIDGQKDRFEDSVQNVDVVLDTVGGPFTNRSFAVLKPGGILVSAVDEPDQNLAATHNVQARFFLVDVNTQDLTRIGELIDSGQLVTQVGEVLKFAEAQLAHDMLAGKPHKPGKIVLNLDM